MMELSQHQLSWSMSQFYSPMIGILPREQPGTWLQSQKAENSMLIWTYQSSLEDSIGASNTQRGLHYCRERMGLVDLQDRHLYLSCHKSVVTQAQSQESIFRHVEG